MAFSSRQGIVRSAAGKWRTRGEQPIFTVRTVRIWSSIHLNKHKPYAFIYILARIVLMKKPSKLKRPKHSSTEGRSMLRSWRVFESGLFFRADAKLRFFIKEVGFIHVKRKRKRIAGLDVGP